MTTVQVAKVPLDKMAAAYLRLRSEKESLTRRFEGELKVLDDAQDQIKSAMKDELQLLGAKSINTIHGTIIMTTKTRYFTQDWEEFGKFVIEHNALDLLEKRVAQGNMKQWLSENPTLVPPGLNSNNELDISVRKAKE